MTWLEQDSETIRAQALYTAHDFMNDAVRHIDKTFGDGFSKANPELVAAYMRTAVEDSAATLVAQRIEFVGKMLAKSLNDVAGQLHAMSQRQ